MTDASFDPPQETGALIDPIVTRYHEMLRAGPASLVPLAERVDQVHDGDPDTSRGLARARATLMQEMEDHMAREEVIPFPAMRAGGGTATLPGGLAAHIALENDVLFPRFEPAT